MYKNVTLWKVEFVETGTTNRRTELLAIPEGKMIMPLEEVKKVVEGRDIEQLHVQFAGTGWYTGE